MKAIPMPVSRDEKIEVIQRYFYGSHPHYQGPPREDEGKAYPAYYGLRKYPKGVEPDPREIIAEHVGGVRVWASRATSSAGAHFAAIDVDTTDAGVLRELRERLDALYGLRAYNWEEREGSGVHVWFLWDGVIERELGEALVGPIDRDEWLSDVVDVIYPHQKGVLRIPFPGRYQPEALFESSELMVLGESDLLRLQVDVCDPPECGTAVSELKLDCPTIEKLPVPDDTKKEVHKDVRTQSVGPVTSLSGTVGITERISLRERVDRFLYSPPCDGAFYQSVIEENFLSHCIGVYGEETGIAKLRDWIHRGNPEKAVERLHELDRFIESAKRRGYAPSLAIVPFQHQDVVCFKDGMFDDLLSFIRRSDIRSGVSRCLFAMLVCVYRTRAYNIFPWWISTRDLAEGLGYDRESGRKRVERHLNWIVVGRRPEQLPAFRIVKVHTQAKACRYALEPDYEFLLDRLPELPPLHREQ